MLAGSLRERQQLHAEVVPVSRRDAREARRAAVAVAAARGQKAQRDAVRHGGAGAIGCCCCRCCRRAPLLLLLRSCGAGVRGNAPDSSAAAAAVVVTVLDVCRRDGVVEHRVEPLLDAGVQLLKEGLGVALRELEEALALLDLLVRGHDRGGGAGGGGPVGGGCFGLAPRRRGGSRRRRSSSFSRSSDAARRRRRGSSPCLAPGLRERVVPVRVRPLEHAAAPDDLRPRVAHEPQLSRRRRRRLAQRLELGARRRRGGRLLGPLPRAVVLRPALVVVHVALERRLGALARQRGVVERALVLGGLVAVAGVKAAGALAVVGPGPDAEPAELEAALRAGHVHAALVLLDGPLALGALLGVGQDPVEVFRLGRVLDEPAAHRLAADRPVRLLAAGEAEVAAAVAVDVDGRAQGRGGGQGGSSSCGRSGRGFSGRGGSRGGGGGRRRGRRRRGRRRLAAVRDRRPSPRRQVDAVQHLRGALAARRRAPGGPPVVFDERARRERLVPLAELRVWRSALERHSLGHGGAALWRRAAQVEAGRASLDRGFHEARVAVHAVGVAAVGRARLVGRVVGEADQAREGAVGVGLGRRRRGVGIVLRRRGLSCCSPRLLLRRRFFFFLLLLLHRQAAPSPHLGLVREPLLVRARDVPLEVAQHARRVGVGDREHCGGVADELALALEDRLLVDDAVGRLWSRVECLVWLVLEVLSGESRGGKRERRGVEEVEVEIDASATAKRGGGADEQRKKSKTNTAPCRSRLLFFPPRRPTRAHNLSLSRLPMANEGQKSSREHGESETRMDETTEGKGWNASKQRGPKHDLLFKLTLLATGSSSTSP